MASNEKTQITFEVEDEMKKRLEKTSEKEHSSQASVMRRAIDEYCIGVES